MKKNHYSFTSLVVALSLLLSACSGIAIQNGTSQLKASGTISAREVNIAPQIGGEVVSVSVEEGTQVKAGDELFRLDNSLLNAQRNIALAGLETAKSSTVVAEAAVAAAQAQYDAVMKSALSMDAQNRTSDWLADKPADFTQPGWFFSKAEQKQAAQNNVLAAQEALNVAAETLKEVEGKAGSTKFQDVEQKLSDARLAFFIAQAVLDRATGSNTQDLKDQAQTLFDDAKSDLVDAQKDYDEAITTEGASDVLEARAKLQIAQERYNAALDFMRSLETGLDAPQVIAAERGLDQAKAVYEQAKSAVKQAEASLVLIDEQIKKTVITAPIDGVVLTRNLEVGEMAAPGGLVMTIGQLQSVELVVYIPETEYGTVHLGDHVIIAVDSFPNETFSGSVIYISDKAEFTPRNVQTVEGRQATVYAIKLSVPNPDLKLKPGMPADVTFTNNQ